MTKRIPKIGRDKALARIHVLVNSFLPQMVFLGKIVIFLVKPVFLDKLH